jgi:hypothetical protein
MKPKTTLTVRWRIRCQGALGPSPVKSLDDEEAAKTKLAEVRAVRLTTRPAGTRSAWKRSPL